MKYIALAAYNNELIIINDMDAFTAHFCYSKKQRQGAIDIPVPAVETPEEDEMPIPGLEVEEVETPDEDDL